MIGDRVLIGRFIIWAQETAHRDQKQKLATHGELSAEQTASNDFLLSRLLSCAAGFKANTSYGH